MPNETAPTQVDDAALANANAAWRAAVARVRQARDALEAAGTDGMHAARLKLVEAELAASQAGAELARIATLRAERASGRRS